MIITDAKVNLVVYRRHLLLNWILRFKDKNFCGQMSRTFPPKILWIPRNLTPCSPPPIRMRLLPSLQIRPTPPIVTDHWLSSYLGLIPFTSSTAATIISNILLRNRNRKSEVAPITQFPQFCGVKSYPGCGSPCSIFIDAAAHEDDWLWYHHCW